MKSYRIRLCLGLLGWLLLLAFSTSRLHAAPRAQTGAPVLYLDSASALALDEEVSTGKIQLSPTEAWAVGFLRNLSKKPVANSSLALDFSRILVACQHASSNPVALRVSGMMPLGFMSIHDAKAFLYLYVDESQETNQSSKANKLARAGQTLVNSTLAKLFTKMHYDPGSSFDFFHLGSDIIGLAPGDPSMEAVAQRVSNDSSGLIAQPITLQQLAIQSPMPTLSENELKIWTRTAVQEVQREGERRLFLITSLLSKLSALAKNQTALKVAAQNIESYLNRMMDEYSLRIEELSTPIVALPQARSGSVATHYSAKCVPMIGNNYCGACQTGDCENVTVKCVPEKEIQKACRGGGACALGCKITLDDEMCDVLGLDTKSKLPHGQLPRETKPIETYDAVSYCSVVHELSHTRDGLRCNLARTEAIAFQAESNCLRGIYRSNQCDLNVKEYAKEYWCHYLAGAIELSEGSKNFNSCLADIKRDQVTYGKKDCKKCQESSGASDDVVKLYCHNAFIQAL